MKCQYNTAMRVAIAVVTLTNRIQAAMVNRNSMRRYYTFIFAIAMGMAQTVPSQFQGLSTSTDNLYPYTWPPMPLPGASYIDTYHPNGTGFVSMQRMPALPATCSIRNWASNANIGPGDVRASLGSYWTVPWSANAQSVGQVTKVTNAATAPGDTVLYFASTAHTSFVTPFVTGIGYTITGTNIPSGTTLVSFTATSVTISQAVTGAGVASGATITIANPPPLFPFSEINHQQACETVQTVNAYSKRQAYNSDNSRILMLARNGVLDSMAVFQTNPLRFERTFVNQAMASNTNSESWSHTDPDLIYVHKNLSGPVLQSYKVSTGVTTDIHNFSSYCGAAYQNVANGGEGNQSADDRYFALWCKAGGGQTYEKIMVYDRTLNQVVSQRTLASICGGTPPAIDWMGMSPSGLYVIVAWNYSTTEDNWATCRGQELFDRTTLESRGMIFSVTGHSDVGYDVNGYEMMMSGPSGHYTSTENAPKYKRINVTKLSEVRPPPYTLATSYVRRYPMPCSFNYRQVGTDPYTGCDESKSYFGQGYHISGRGSEAQAGWGWWLMTTYGFGYLPQAETPGWGHNENIAFRIDTNEPTGTRATFRRISRTLSHRANIISERCTSDLWAEPHGAPNRGFTALVFTSSWMYRCGASYGYEIVLPTQAQQTETLTVSANRRGESAVITFGRRGMPMSTSCTVQAMNGSTVVATLTSLTGRATRQVGFSELPSVNLTFSVACGTEIGSVSTLATADIKGELITKPVTAAGSFTVEYTNGLGAADTATSSSGEATLTSLHLGVVVPYRICRDSHCGVTQYYIP